MVTTENSFLRSAYYFLSASLFKKDGSKKRYPRVVQLPITYRCNSKCVMCNIWQMDYSNEMSVDEFSRFMKDEIFSRVEAVGINGGEPSLIRELPAFTDEILKLPRLKNLNIISHGFNKKLLLPALEEMYKKCKSKNIRFHVSISLDGYGETHDAVRGLKVFKLTSDTILELKNNRKKYCDTLDLGCTVMLQNIDRLSELDAYARLHGLDIRYRLAIENKRIESGKLLAQFSLLHHQVYQSAREFFHSRYLLANELKRKFKYFSIYYFLTAEKPKRLMGCHWQDNGITVDSRGDLYYCPVKSEKLGGLREAKGTDIFFSEKNIKHRKRIVAHDCDDCIHDYDGRAYIGNLLVFLREIIFEKYYWVNYYLKTRLT